MIDWQTLRRPLAAVALGGMLATTLTGCIEMAVGGVVVTALAASDRRTLGAQTEDRAIQLKAESRVSKLLGDNGHVNINSYNRKALLTGEVRDEQFKAAVEREVAGVEGVQSVVNEIAVMGSSGLAARSNDTLITGKVKASFVDAKDLFANSFKIVTERGTVYLMGRVTDREGRRAAEVAAGVPGVQRVVKVFEYISEDELKKMSTAKPAQ